MILNFYHSIKCIGFPLIPPIIVLSIKVDDLDGAFFSVPCLQKAKVIDEKLQPFQ